jgi:integrase
MATLIQSGKYTMDRNQQAPRLLDKLVEAIRTRHYSIRTEEAYVRWVKTYIRFHGNCHPAALGAPELEAFLTYLAVSRNVAASTQNQALSAILFLYREVLNIELPWLKDVTRAKKPERLPVVLTPEEVQQVLAALEGTTALMGRLLYGSGLRLMEGVRLRVKDVDFSRCEILVREAKGNKDRITMLPRTLVEPLQRHLQRVRLLHEEDMAAGHGRVWLPHALAVKKPGRRWSGAGSTSFHRHGCRWTRAPARCAATMWTRNGCNARSRSRCARSVSTSRRPRIPCATASPRTCWRVAMTSAPYRSCWGTPMSRRRRFTCTC